MNSLDPQLARLARPEDLLSLNLPDWEVAFARLELGRDPAHLQARLQALGFQGRRRVLDCACGIGHWSVISAFLNSAVIGLDQNPHRLAVAELQKKLNDRNNLHFVEGNAESLPFPDGHFDALFCYGAFMFLHPRRALREFRRVLEPGGLLYLNANGLGWYWIELVRVAIRRRSPRLLLAAARFTARTAIRRWFVPDMSQTIFNRHEIRRILEEEGFTVRAVGDEGTIGAPTAPPFYRGRYGPWNGVIEVLAERRGGD